MGQLRDSRPQEAPRAGALTRRPGKHTDLAVSLERLSAVRWLSEVFDRSLQEEGRLTSDLTHLLTEVLARRLCSSLPLNTHTQSPLADTQYADRAADPAGGCSML